MVTQSRCQHCQEPALEVFTAKHGINNERHQTRGLYPSYSRLNNGPYWFSLYFTRQAPLVSICPPKQPPVPLPRSLDEPSRLVQNFSLRLIREKRFWYLPAARSLGAQTSTCKAGSLRFLLLPVQVDWLNRYHRP